MPSSLGRQEIPFLCFKKNFDEEGVDNVEGLWSSEHQGHCYNAHCPSSESSLLSTTLCMGISAEAGSFCAWC